MTKEIFVALTNLENKEGILLHQDELYPTACWILRRSAVPSVRMGIYKVSGTA